MPEIFESPEIWHRGDFAVLATWRNYTRVIEVGVDRGDFAAVFLSRWINGNIYLGVDPYEPYPEMPFNRDGDFYVAASKFAPYPHVAKLIRESSSTVATEIARNLGKYHYTRPYNLVYIDAAHDFESVMANLTEWWPIVAEGGMLAGHDWHDDSGDNEGVQLAVRAFADLIGLTVYFTGLDNPSSWYVYKDAEVCNRPNWR